MHSKERREFQRLKLTKPILATIPAGNALILDIGLAGAFLEHYGTVRPGDRFSLIFRWQGQEVDFLCEVVRSSIVRTPGGDGQSPVSHTGVRFLQARGESARLLQDLIGSFVGHIIEAQKANASGEQGESAGATVLARLGDARRMRSRHFIVCTFEEGRWTRTETDVRKQPHNGFTVGEHEDEEEIESLCRTYEAADEEARELIRLVAELSLLKER